MKGFRIVLVLVVLATGCTLPPCHEAIAGDAGGTLPDAEVGEGATPGLVGSVWACGLIDHLTGEAALAGAYGPCLPAPPCPWPAYVSPSHPEAFCNPEAVVACIQAVDQANTCDGLAVAIAACDADACRRSTGG